MNKIVQKFQADAVLHIAENSSPDGEMVMRIPPDDWKPKFFADGRVTSGKQGAAEKSRSAFLRNGQFTIGQVAALLGKTPSTILGHFIICAQNSMTLPWTRLRDFFPTKSKFELCENLIVDPLDASTKTKPIYEQANGKLTYDDINWYLMLKRVKCPVEWEAPTKRQRKN